MDQQELIKKAEIHARKLYEENPNPVFVYHNVGHVETMVQAAVKIASHYNLDDQDLVAVYIASWFHDTGYLFVDDEHEEKSAQLAASFLRDHKANPHLIRKVKECILATRIYSKPQSLIGKIVSDADLHHLGTKDFWRNDQKMREETELRIGKKISPDRWQLGALQLMEKHQYHTDYCQNHLQKGKEENIQLLKKQLKEEMNGD